MENEKKLTIEHLFWYFVIFSILGLVIETLYCYASTGVLESRKGLIWGPLCPVYGVCGTFLVYMLYKLKCKSTVGIFVAGVIIGSISEYFLSYALEAVYGTRFWNYEYLNFNINGRISLLFFTILGYLIHINNENCKTIDRQIYRQNEPKNKRSMGNRNFHILVYRLRCYNMGHTNIPKQGTIQQATRRNKRTIIKNKNRNRK